MRNSEISFYVDTLIVETVLGDTNLYKTAQGGGIITDLLSKVRDYVSNNVDPNNKLHSLINLLAPGVISMGFRAIGLGWVGILFGLIASTLKIDIAGWISSIWSSLRGSLESGEKVTPDQVDAAVHTGMQGATAAAPDEHKAALSFDEYMKEARILRLAMEEYEKQTLRLTKGGELTKEAQSWASLLSNRRGTTSILAKIIGWIFKVALASAGFLVAGGALRKWLGIGEGKEAPSGPAAPAATTAKQTKFPFKGDSPLPSTVPMSATSEAIESLLIQYAKDTYSGLDGKEDIIRNSPAFQAVKSDIAWFNFHGASRGGSVVFIPPNFTSKRKLVDFFIDDVAQRAI